MPRDPLLHFLKRKTAPRFALLVQRTQRVVENAAYRVLGDAHRAEDVAQEVYMKALRDDWDPRRIRSGIGWLVHTTVLLARTRLRSETRRAARERAPAPDAATSALTPAEAAEVREAVFDLPDDLRACVELAYFGGMSAGDIAGHLDVTPRAVSKRLQRARGELAPRLEGRALACIGPACDLPGTLPELAAPVDPERVARWTAQGARDGHFVAGGLSARWVAAAVMLLLVGGAVTTLSLRTSPGRDDARPPEPVADAGPGHDGPRRAPGLLTAGGPDGRGDTAADPRTLGAARGGAAAPAGAKAGTFSLAVRVVDADGALVRQGHVRLQGRTVSDQLRIMRLTTDHGATSLLAFAWLLEPIDLSESNPIEVTDLPAVLDGLGFAVHADVPGLALGTAPVEFTVRSGVREDVTLRLVPTRSVEVEVKDEETGAWIAGVSVQSRTERERRGLVRLDSGTGPGQGLTDDTGRCTLTELGSGDHTVDLVVPGYVRATRTLTADQTGLAVGLRRLRGGGIVEVVVLDPHGAPVMDLPLDVITQGFRRPVKTTDAHGRATYEHVPAGFVTVTVDAAAWIPLAKRLGKRHDDGVQMRIFELGKDERRTIELGFPSATASIRVEVSHEDDKAVAGLDVRLVGARVVRAKTDEHGHCVFPELPEGRYYIGLEHGSEWTWQSPALTRGKTFVHRIVVGSAEIRGRVLVDGKPARARVSLSGDRDADAVSRLDGVFAFRGLPRGTYTLDAFQPSSRRLAIPHVVHLESLTPEPVDLPLTRPGTLHVRVDTRAATGEVSVTARRSGDDAFTLVRGDEEGVWTGDGLLPGDYEVVVQKGAGPTRHAVTVRAGEVTKIDD